MTREELTLHLSRIGVHEDSYSLDGIKNSDRVCVEKTDNTWKVYYVERDKPEELVELNSAEDAYDFVYKTFCKWFGL